MSTPNPFDQFDEPAKRANAFNQFDSVQEQQQPNTWGQAIKNVGQAGAHFTSAGAGGFLGDVAGLVSLMAPPAMIARKLGYEGGILDPANVRETVANALTYTPNNQDTNPMKVATFPGRVIAGAGEMLAKPVEDIPYMGNLARAVPVAAANLLGAKGIKSAPKVVMTSGEEAALRQQAKGYTIPPSQANPTTLNTLLEGAPGKIKTKQIASTKNQPISNAILRTDADLSKFGLNDAADLTPDVLADVRKQAGEKYRDLSNLGTIKPKPEYFKNLIEIGKDYSKASKEFGTPSPVLDWVKQIVKKREFSAESAVEMTQILREEADKATRAGDKRLAAGLRGISKNFEEALEGSIDATQGAAMLEDFRSARRAIAKTYTVEKYLTGRGNINAEGLAAELKKGKLSGPLEEIAQFGADFRDAAQTPEKVGSVTPYSPLDLGAAAISGNKEGMLAMASRAPVRALITSKAYQRGPGRARSMGEKITKAKAQQARRRALGTFGVASLYADDEE